jgi:c-di-GMP-binding flagellar brake protein YcgR
MSSAFPSNGHKGDSRDAQTKIFQRRAFLNVDHLPPIPARTLDISSLGLSVIVDQPLPEGRKLTIDVSVVLDEQSIQAHFSCTVRSNVLAGMKGFRVGLEFDELDADASQLIKQIMSDG